MASAGQHLRTSPGDSMHSHETDDDAVSLAHRLLTLAKLAATTLAALGAAAKAFGLV